MRLAWFAPLVVCAATAHANPSILICYADFNGAQGAMQIAQGINSGNDFNKVDLVDCGTQTPTLATMKTYEGIFLWDDNQYADKTTLGNNLADYVDAGGGVVQGEFDFYNSQPGWDLQGRWATGGYNCIVPSPNQMFDNLKAQPNDVNSPLVKGVANFTTDNGAACQLANGATSVWDYASGHPAIAQCMPGGHLRVDLGFYPIPSNWMGDGYVMIKNALLAVSGGLNPLRGAPNPVSFPDTGTSAQSNPINVVYTNTSMMAQTVTSAAIGGTNAGDFVITTLPALPVTVQPMATVTVAAAFAPTAGGMRSGKLSLTVTNQMSTADVTLQGTALPSQVKVAPFPIDMGGSQIGVPVMKNVTISNTGGGKVLINNAVVTLDQAEFSVSSAPPYPVALGAGSSFMITVKFVPTTNGLHNGTLTVTSNDPNTPTINVPITGYAGPPMITLDAGTLAFGNVNVGASSNQLITVTNTGFSDLIVSAITLGGANPGDFLIVPMNLPGTIAPQKAQQFGVTFKPTTTGNRSATVTVSSNDSGSPNKVVNVLGTGTTAMMALNPLALDFGDTHVMTKSAVKTVTVSDSGTGTLMLKAINITGPDATSFAVSGMPMPPFNVQPGVNTPVGLACTPTRVGALTATASFVSDVNSIDVALTCNGTAPIIMVTPSPIDFGTVPQNSKSQPMAVTIMNAGTDPLGVSVISIVGAQGGDFTSADLPAVPLTIQAMQSVVFHLVFTPGSQNAETGQLQFMSNDPTTMNLTVALLGNGAKAGLTVTPTPTVDCGSAAIGSKAPPKPVTISNIGSLPITVTSIAVGGAGAAQFTVDQPGPLTLPPMSMATVNVTFQPQATGSVQATLTITPMGFVPVTLTLRGNGTGAMVQVAPSTLTFPDTAVGSTSDQQLIGVKNSGQTAVMLQSPSVSDPQFALNLGGFTPMLQAGAQTTFAVTFTPSAASAASAQVSISLAGQNQPVAMVALAGNGIDAGPGGGCTCALARPRRAPLGLGLLALAVVALALRRTRRR